MSEAKTNIANERHNPELTIGISAEYLAGKRFDYQEDINASADVDLMKRLIDVLGKTPHRFIVSKGPQHDQYELADNMVGSEFLPQTTLIPHVDAIITHGGNNTTTEAMHFGKPMILLPLFWDQYDNAQRMDEIGFGVRLATYDFTDDEMNSALATVLDPAMQAKMSALGVNVRSRDGLRKGADVIEAVGAAFIDGE